MKIFLYIVLLSLVSGCGFHLRGSQGMDLGVERIHVAGTDRHGEFVRELRRSLEVRDTTVVTGGEEAPYSLRVMGENTTRRSVATTSDITVSEYELRMTVEFELLDASGQQLIEPMEIVAERIYVFDRQSLAGSSQEEDLLKEEMRRDLVRQMIHRVNATVKTASS
ncbi:MAG: LPS assembly lipoprotein LptE [Pseudomonadales bacterium]